MTPEIAGPSSSGSKPPSTTQPFRPQDSSENQHLLDKIQHLTKELEIAHDQIAQQQRKWDKLKENVKRKRESKKDGGEGEEGGDPGSSSMRNDAGSSMYYSAFK